MLNHLKRYDEINLQLFNELQASFGHYQFAEINDIVEAVDQFYLIALKRYLVIHSNFYLEKSVAADNNAHIVHHTGLLELNIGNSVISHRILEIALVHRLASREKHYFNTHTFKLNSFGRYAEFHFQYPEKLKIVSNNFDLLMGAISNTIYNWLEAFIYSKLADLETELSRDLYFYVRTTFHDEALLKRFWFVTVKDNKGYCLFDRRLAQDMLWIAKQLPENSALPPAGITAHFLSNEADFDLMASKDAIILGKCINVPFKKTKYSKIDIDFSESEAAIHDADSISLFPLIREGKGMLLAAFPTPARAYFEPKVLNHSEQICDIFYNRFNTIKKLIGNLKKPNNEHFYGKVGELIGGFTKTMIE